MLTRSSIGVLLKGYNYFPCVLGLKKKTVLARGKLVNSIKG